MGGQAQLLLAALLFLVATMLSPVAADFDDYMCGKSYGATEWVKCKNDYYCCRKSLGNKPVPNTQRTAPAYQFECARVVCPEGFIDHTADHWTTAMNDLQVRENQCRGASRCDAACEGIVDHLQAKTEPWVDYFATSCTCVNPAGGQSPTSFGLFRPLSEVQHRKRLGDAECKPDAILRDGQQSAVRMGVNFKSDVELKAQLILSKNPDTQRRLQGRIERNGDMQHSHTFHINSAIYEQGYAGQVFMARWTTDAEVNNPYLPNFVGLKLLFEPLKWQHSKKWPTREAWPPSAVYGKKHASNDETFWSAMLPKLDDELVGETFAGSLDAGGGNSMPYALRTFGHFVATVPSRLEAVLKADRHEENEPHDWNSAATKDVTPGSSTVFIILEWLPYGDLYKAGINSYMFYASSPIHKMVRALAALSNLGGWLMYMEKRQLVHRDIKPKNIMWDGLFGIRVIDFGELAHFNGEGVLVDPDTKRPTDRHFAKPYQDKQQFLPLEARIGQRTRAFDKADVYGVGLVFLELLLSGLPDTADFFSALEPKKNVPVDVVFAAAHPPKTIPKIPTGVFVNSKRKDYKDELQAIVDGMMAPHDSRWAPAKVAHAARELYVESFSTEEGRFYLKMHGSKSRPIQAGIEVQTTNADMGTIGYILTDGKQLAYITNAHVVADIRESKLKNLAMCQPEKSAATQEIYDGHQFPQYTTANLPKNLAFQSVDFHRAGYLAMVAANDETAAILNAGVCNRVGVFNHAYWAEEDAQSLDYAVMLLNQPDLVVECSVRAAGAAGKAAPITGIHPLAAITGKKDITAEGKPYSVSVVDDKAKGLSVVKVGVVTTTLHAKVILTNFVLQIDKKKPPTFCHYVIVAETDSTYDASQLPEVTPEHPAAGPGQADAVKRRARLGPRAAPKHVDLGPTEKMVPGLKTLLETKGTVAMEASFETQLIQGGHVTMSSHHGDSGSSYTVPHAGGLHALALHAASVDIMWEMKHDAFDALFGSTPTASQGYYSYEGGNVILKLPSGSTKPTIKAATVTLADSRVVEVHIAQWYKGSCGVSIHHTLDHFNAKVQALPRPKDEAAPEPFDVCVQKEDKQVPSAWVDACEGRITKATCLRLVIAQTTRPRCQWSDSQHKCSDIPQSEPVKATADGKQSPAAGPTKQKKEQLKLLVVSKDELEVKGKGKGQTVSLPNKATGGKSVHSNGGLEAKDAALQPNFVH